MLGRKEKEAATIYIDSNRFTATYEFSNTFYEQIRERAEVAEHIILLCIGSDRATGDCLGPLVGYKLTSSNEVQNEKIVVYGTLEEPVHAQNLAVTISNIYNNYKNPFVIAIDASLGRLEYIGYMTICEGSVLPGAGVKKDLPAVGDIHITGIVNCSNVIQVAVLQNTRLSVVMKMADIISNALISVFKKIK